MCGVWGGVVSKEKETPSSLFFTGEKLFLLKQQVEFCEYFSGASNLTLEGIFVFWKCLLSVNSFRSVASSL